MGRTSDSLRVVAPATDDQEIASCRTKAVLLQEGITAESIEFLNCAQYSASIVEISE
jgi:hypothetical protein